MAKRDFYTGYSVSYNDQSAITGMITAFCGTLFFIKRGKRRERYRENGNTSGRWDNEILWRGKDIGKY